jgi:hypothetical protein
MNNVSYRIVLLELDKYPNDPRPAKLLIKLFSKTVVLYELKYPSVPRPTILLAIAILNPEVLIY